jgi:hypothetical protein
MVKDRFRWNVTVARQVRLKSGQGIVNGKKRECDGTKADGPRSSRGRARRMN